MRAEDAEVVKENYRSGSEEVLGGINMIVVICIRKESSNWFKDKVPGSGCQWFSQTAMGNWEKVFLGGKNNDFSFGCW